MAGADATTPMSGRSIRGFAWMTAQTILDRLLSLGGQIVLAWVLLPDDFGIASLALSIGVMAGIIQQNGAARLLVANPARFVELANPCFWFSIATGILTAIVMMVGGVVAAWGYDKPDLPALVGWLAAAAPLAGATTVPIAALQVELRFRALSTINAAATLVRVTMTILMALSGFGALSFVIPLAVTAGLQVLVLLAVVRPPLRWSPSFDGWKHILPTSGVVMAAAMLNRVVERGDYLILATTATMDVVGVYFFAFTLSMQGIALVGGNVFSVLFPTFSKLQDQPERRAAAMLRAIRLVALVSIPLQVLLAISSDSLIRVVFDDRWSAAVPVMQILCIGLSLRILGSVSTADLNALGRFRMLLWLAAINCAVFFPAALMAAPCGLETFAAAVCAPYVVVPVLSTWIALGSAPGKLARMWSTLRPALFASIAAVVPTVAVRWLLPDTFAGDVLRLLSGAIIFGTVMVLVAAWADTRLRAALLDARRLFTHRRAEPPAADGL
ncbi:MAG: oligosaccharide flippase family protein [Planctomycetota bacterium]